jgi:hypothetical protein
MKTSAVKREQEQAQERASVSESVRENRKCSESIELGV